ncbi:Transcriptional adapter ada2 [Ranunculus cassubicifolius]
MGRSRGLPTSADEDLNQRSKRKRAASSGENLESSVAGQETNEGKRALYHCNYCNKDISGKIRVKCVKCPDFDLCVECFSVGAEVTPHKSNHPYRVMDNLSFPLICPDWNADEEILLLEGIEMYGMGNWAEVAEHVGTKSKVQCIDHYTNAYMNSPCFPLPDMSHVIGKNRKELLAMAKGNNQGRKGFPTLGELPLKEEPAFSPLRIKIEESGIGRSPSSITADSGIGTTAVKKASDMAAHVKDDPDRIKHEESSHVDRSIGIKKPKPLGEEGPSLTELSGYNKKRHEFDPEYDNDAEKSLADMEFKESDTDAEHELKLRMLHIYSRRLDERKRRKDFILERNLLYQDPIVKELSPEEREIYRRYNVFMRFQTKEEHQEMIRTVIEEHRIRTRIRQLQEARDAGCRTSAESDRFIEHKRKKEAEETARKAKELPSGNNKLQQQQKLMNHSNSSLKVETETNSLDDDWDITGLPGSDLLTTTEQRLCSETKMLPSLYLKIQEVISIKIFQGDVTKKSEAHPFFKVDPAKVDKVYDMLVTKGVAHP